MSQALEGVASIIGEERPRIWRYSYSAGPVRSKFLLYLRDQQKIMGTKCPSCGRVYVPARSTCLECFQNMSEWVEVGDEGILTAYTIVNTKSPALGADSVFGFCIVKLDGADTGLTHRLGKGDPEKLCIGMRMKAVFNEELKADIRDIKYFKPLQSSLRWKS